MGRGLQRMEYGEGFTTDGILGEYLQGMEYGEGLQRMESGGRFLKRMIYGEGLQRMESGEGGYNEWNIITWEVIADGM